MTLACALAVEERAARRSGARTALVGLGAMRPLPGGRLVSFGLAGALVYGLRPGTLLTASRIVDEEGNVLWENEPVRVAGAAEVTICATSRIVDDPADRQALAERTGAVAVEMESRALAASGRLAGSVRAIADGPERPLGGLAFGATPDGGVHWRAVLRAFLRAPVRSLRAALAARRALAALETAAADLAKGTA